MIRYFAPIADGHALLSSADGHHLIHVMRATRGTIIEIVASGRLFLATVSSLDPLEISISEEKQASVYDPNITLLLALPKGDKLDFVIQKATELGVTGIILFMSRRSVVRWEKKDVERKIARLSLIAKDASEQSRRLSLPSVNFVFSLEEAAKLPFEQKLIASEHVAGAIPFDISPTSGSAAIMIGPEGGFEPGEIELAERHGFKQISLGDTILRSETAAITAIAVWGYIKRHAHL